LTYLTFNTEIYNTQVESSFNHKTICDDPLSIFDCISVTSTIIVIFHANRCVSFFLFKIEISA